MTSQVDAETIKGLTIGQLKAAIQWVAECCWGDISDEEDCDELTPHQIWTGVERHYSGGIAQFIKDAS